MVPRSYLHVCPHRSLSTHWATKWTAPQPDVNLGKPILFTMNPVAITNARLPQVLGTRHLNTAVEGDGTVLLSELTPGTAGTIVGFACEPDAVIGRRLFDLGFTPGARLELLRRAPLGDPLMVRIAGAEMLLRMSEARLICLRLDAQATPGAA